ncbi:hypothetical protein EYF80_035879 [Liparis tanakae]|uniref:Uncharacterized protein n=1 Tax=Liparis tanakae TaxID=230148 RepID=A0A4Z2GML2_9TELE|nr:hypothetical protein EYF80_035879 [Liparis tanakae]
MQFKALNLQIKALNIQFKDCLMLLSRNPPPPQHHPLPRTQQPSASPVNSSSHYHQCQDSSGGFSHSGQHSAISNPPAEFIRQSNSA